MAFMSTGMSLTDRFRNQNQTQQPNPKPNPKSGLAEKVTNQKFIQAIVRNRIKASSNNQIHTAQGLILGVGLHNPSFRQGVQQVHRNANPLVIRTRIAANANAQRVSRTPASLRLGQRQQSTQANSQFKLDHDSMRVSRTPASHRLGQKHQPDQEYISQQRKKVDVGKDDLDEELEQYMSEARRRKMGMGMGLEEVQEVGRKDGLEDLDEELEQYMSEARKRKLELKVGKKDDLDEELDQMSTEK